MKGMANTASRRRLLRRLLQEYVVRSQAEIVELLAERGHGVTQATVSRDLAAIGASKDGSNRYVLGRSDEVDAALEELAHVLDEYAESIVGSGQLVVVRTPPGAAQVVAGAIDRARVADVLGTVAGDDTVLVITSEHHDAAELAARLERIGENI